ncbi:MAG TPA: hypothetical protein VHR86_00735 [Armatimonadota bacterium]|nr:hypothetical protein [Armatimonadota bacterium]
MRFLKTFLLWAAIILSVYNLLVVQRLRNDVATLQANTSVTSSAGTSQEARAKLLLKQAAKHSAQAQELIHKGKLDEARDEMQKSMQLMSEAADAAGDNNLVPKIRAEAQRTAQRIEMLITNLKKSHTPAKKNE